MLSDPSGRPRLDIVLDALRRRICLAPPGGEIRLHENALATEFEMSRTPIRQALQRLAYERLVETRSGVGTIGTPMRASDRGRDLRTHQGLLRAILTHELGDISLMDRTALAALAAAAREPLPESALAETPGADPNEARRVQALDVRAGLLAAFCRQIPDPILADAFRASHWRVIRWHMSDFVTAPAAAHAALSALVAQMTDTAPTRVERLFQSLLEHDLSA